jgi:hypothetical protein
MTHAFEHLRELALLDDVGLSYRFGPQAISILVVCSRLLRTQPISSDALTPESFVVEMKQLYAEYVAGSRALNEAMDQYADAAKRSDLVAAQNVLHGFLASSNARSIAASQRLALSPWVANDA